MTILNHSHDTMKKCLWENYQHRLQKKFRDCLSCCKLGSKMLIQIQSCPYLAWLLWIMGWSCKRRNYILIVMSQLIKGHSWSSRKHTDKCFYKPRGEGGKTHIKSLCLALRGPLETLIFMPIINFILPVPTQVLIHKVHMWYCITKLSS